MWSLVRRRAFDGVLVVWLVATVSFLLLHLAPGDPVAATLSDPRVPPAVRAHWRTAYALDRPVAEQYGRYVVALVRGNLGYSFSQNRPVADALRDTLPYSLLLMGLALAASVLLGASLGVVQAMRTGSRLDGTIAVVTSALAAVPEAWMALVLLALLGAELSLFPLSGRCDPTTCGSLSGWRAAFDLAQHVALPALTLTLLLSAVFARVQRVALRDVLHDDVMRTARAKGVSEPRILTHHAIRRAARPLVTMIGLSLPVLVGGTVFVERVFGWPGMGSLLLTAIGVRDYPLVTATAIAASLLVLLGSLVADMVSARLDPRWRGVHA